MLKKYLIISLINLFISFSVFVNEDRIKKLVYEKIMPDDKYAEYMVNNNIFSKMVISQKVSEGFSNEYNKYGIKFKYPNGWNVIEIRGNKCGNIGRVENFCIHVVDKVENNFIAFKVVKFGHNPGGGLITENDIASNLSIKTNKDIYFLRSLRLNDYYLSEYRQNIIGVDFIQRIFLYPMESNFGIYYGGKTIWLYNGEEAISIYYSINSNKMENSHLIIDNATIQTLDKIVSTLEINFDEMEF